MTTCSLRARRTLDSQGFSRIEDDVAAARLARAARFQPQATLVLLASGLGLVATGIVSTTYAAAWFGVLALVGWLAVALPATNAFDRLWELTGGIAVGRPPAPRRFSQAIAATFLTTIAVLFAASATTAAFVVSGVMAFAASLAAFADVCVGSELYRVATRRTG